MPYKRDKGLKINRKSVSMGPVKTMESIKNKRERKVLLNKGRYLDIARILLTKLTLNTMATLNM